MRVLLVTVCVALVAPEAADAQRCGYTQLPPSGGRIGTAPLAIGDSVMLGAARQLSRRGFEVDSRCARDPEEGIRIMRQRRRRGTLPEIVVMALGTNVAVARQDIGRMLRAIGPRRTLMPLTPYRQWRPFHTGPVRYAERRWPKRVKLIDWSRRAERNRDWFVKDGTHLQPAGVAAYTRMLKRAAWSRLRGRFGGR